MRGKFFNQVAVVIAFAGVTVPIASAATPDAFERAVNIHNAALASGASVVATHLGTPDARDGIRALGGSGASQVARTLGTPDTRDVVRSFGGSGASQIAARIGTPDTRDAVRAFAESGAASMAVRTLGTPDTRDAAQLARLPVTSVASNGFDWGDAGIGAGGAMGFVLLLGLGGTMLVRQKHRLGRA